MKKEPIIVNVYLWGTCIGKLNWDFEKHCSVFQFTDEYRKQDYDICPSTHPKRTLTMPKFTSQILLLFSKVLHILENLLLKNFTGLKVVS